MENSDSGVVDPSAGGAVGLHPPQDILPVLAGTSTADQFNTIRSALIPFACWRADDMRFAFGKSFVKPTLKKELRKLAQLIGEHPQSPLSVFGHADPVGSDDFNKQLSGRRATAIYAMLIRDVDLWEALFSQALGKDDWGDDALTAMVDAVSEQKAADAAKADPNAGASDDDAAKPSIDPFSRSASQRKQLYASYMDLLCGPKLKLTKKDFLAQGADAGGKGDYQGCGEFNPLTIFSSQEQSDFDASDDKGDRDEANAPNRRVMVLLFRKGSRVDPARWPCPRVKEGVGGCIKRFWSDADKRRAQGDHRREQRTDGDTFACRFYERVSSSSPCEALDNDSESQISIVLRSNSGAVPLAKLPYRLVTEDGPDLAGTTDKNGLIAHPHVAPGDYVLVLNGTTTDIAIPTVPQDIKRVPLRVPDAVLFTTNDPPPVGDEDEPKPDVEDPGDFVDDVA